MAEASTSLDATVTLGSFRLGASVCAGAPAPGPVGVVAGGPSVRLDGRWAGGSLLVGLLL